MNRFFRTGNHNTEGIDQPPTPVQCRGCETDLTNDTHFAQTGICAACGRVEPISAAQWIDLLFDTDSFDERFSGVRTPDPLEFSDSRPYMERLEEAREKSGEREAVATGTAEIGGHSVVVAVSDFRFIGGSMGFAVGERVAIAMDEARKAKVPFVVVTSSGGARMQEGMVALLQMAKTAAAAQRLHADLGIGACARLPHPGGDGAIPPARGVHEQPRGAGRSVDLLAVMHLQHFDVPALAEARGGLFDEAAQDGDAGAGVGGLHHGNPLGQLPKVLLKLPGQAGGADHQGAGMLRQLLQQRAGPVGVAVVDDHVRLRGAVGEVEAVRLTDEAEHGGAHAAVAADEDPSHVASLRAWRWSSSRPCAPR